MAPASIVFPDPLFLFQTPTKTMNRGFRVLGPLPPPASFTLKMDTIIYTKILEMCQHIMWPNFENGILVLRFSQPAFVISVSGVYPNCMLKLFQCFDIHCRCHLLGEWGGLWDLYIRPHPPSPLFTLKMVTEINIELLKQFHGKL
jgi:hypothetical protein